MYKFILILDYKQYYSIMHWALNYTLEFTLKPMLNNIKDIEN